MLGIIVLPMSVMVTCKETLAVIIALHKKVFTGNDIAASMNATKSTINCSIKNFKDSGSIVVTASGRPKIPASARTVSSTELAQKWQQAGVSASARTVRRRLLEDGLVSRKTSGTY